MTHATTTNISANPPSPWKTLARVNRLASLGLTVPDIAVALRISVAATLALYEADILAAYARAKSKALELVRILVKSGKSIAATLFWARHFLKSNKTADPDRKSRTPNHNGEILSDAPLNLIFVGPNGEQD